MGGCTNCGGKERCDDRKHVMFAAIDDALARMYPSRRWGERDDAAALGAGIGGDEARRLASVLAERLKAAVIYRPGDESEYCDWLYVLCVGREPCLAALRESGASLPAHLEPPVRELYLRVCLSSLGRLAAVQQTALELEPQGGGLVLRERPRSGVWDAPLLPRMQKLVAALIEHDIVHLDFGDLTTAPAGFDPGDYGSLYAGTPDLASYLFFPQPWATETLTLLASSALA
jgi:hypothetical protein